MKLENEDIKKIAVGILVVSGLIFSLVFLFGGNKKETEINHVDVTAGSTSSTYESKLQAYKEKKRREKENAYKMGYNSELQIIQPDSEVKSTITEEITINQPAKGKQESPTVRTTMPAKTSVSSPKRHEEIDNLESIIKNRPIEKKNDTPALLPEQVPANTMDDKERRRKAMLAWNKQNTGTTNQTFTAVIHKTQTVLNGRMAVFRTREEINTGNIKIPANTLIYGTVNITTNRVNVNISSVTINKNVFPVKFNVFGTDGAPGIPVQIDNIQKAADAKINDEIVSVAKRRTGIVGDVLGGIATAVKREKEISCTLIDNQTIYLKLN
ncbi:conjugative transposon protein TraM [Tissierella sp.]|uniref:conjugative transposon protein TraM n=1 Tax=Tissierella sp. TaxID=41274 RepID=UPI0030579EF5